MTTGPARLTAAALSFAAAMLAVVGSFLPLFTAKQGVGMQTIEVTNTSWGMDIVGGYSLVDIPRNGYPLVCAGIVLAFAAVRCWYAAKPGATPGTQRVAGVATAIGGTFLTCAVWMVALQVSNWADSWGPPPADVGDFRLRAETSYLVGYWILLVAALLGVVAAVLALLPVREPTWHQAPVVDPDAPTPPYGIALPIPPEAPLVMTVDPLTGEPLGSEPSGLPAVPPTPPLEPIVIPEAPRAPESPPGPAVPPTEDPLAEPRHD